jgi:hypothetical protein
MSITNTTEYNRAAQEAYRARMSEEAAAEYRERNATNLRNNTRAKKKRLIAEMGGECVDCKQSPHPAAFEFHHINPEEKEGNVSQLLRGSYDVAKEEAMKCVLLCSNCHRTRHATEFDQW